MNKKHPSFKKYILLSFGVLFICILFIIITTMRSLLHMQQETTENNLSAFTSRVVQDVEQTYENIENISLSIAYTQIVQAYLMENEKTSKEQKFTSYNNIYSLLNSTQKLNSSILDIAIIGANENSANISSDITVYQEMMNAMTESKNPIQFLGKTTIYIREESYDVQIAALPIYKTSNLTEFLGVLFIALDPGIVIGNTDQSTEGFNINLILTDNDGQLLSGNDQIYQSILDIDAVDIFSVTYKSTKYECQRFEIASSNVVLYTLYDKSGYISKTLSIMYRQILFFTLSFIFAVVLLVIFLKPVMASIRQLTTIMNEIGSGKRRAMNERIVLTNDKYCSDEVFSIVNAFNDMLDETLKLNRTIFDSYTKMYELEMINRATEIAFLRSQINPHFLYNTLTLICGMSAVGETQRVIDVTQALSQIFRYSIKGNDMVSISEEFEIVKSYVMIQMLRFEDRFTVEFNFSEEAKKAYIPKMILQPLVENAITHGLEKSLKKGHLQIGALKDARDNTLVMWIYDTGVGMTEKKLAQIRKLLSETGSRKINDAAKELQQLETENQDSVGLCNVNSRISLYYGEEYMLKVDSHENVGTNIQMRLPYNTK